VCCTLLIAVTLGLTTTHEHTVAAQNQPQVESTSKSSRWTPANDGGLQAWQHFEAPNWSRDGRRSFSTAAAGCTRFRWEADGDPARHRHATRCNNDHGYSPDGAQLQSVIPRTAISDLRPAGCRGDPRLVTPKSLILHGCLRRPDPRYCAERNGEYDIYTIRRLRRGKAVDNGPGLDDGPDYP